MDLVVVDGSNVVNAAGRALRRRGASDQDVHGYLADWFDIDRWVSMSAFGVEHLRLGMVTFHSPGRQLGAKAWRLEAGTDVEQFWARQGAFPNCSSVAVEIPGRQQEQYDFECEQCGCKNTSSLTTEKGVDTSITAYLLETADQWESACVVSSDVDLVPPVLSLRRKGKRVFVLAEAQEPPSLLARVCQSFHQFNGDFLLADFTLYQLCRDGGVFSQLVAEFDRPPEQQLRFEIGPNLQVVFVADAATQAQEDHRLGARLACNLSQYSGQAPTHSLYTLQIHEQAVKGINRRLTSLNWRTNIGCAQAIDDARTRAASFTREAAEGTVGGEAELHRSSEEVEG